MVKPLGQQLNISKSSILFGNNSSATKPQDIKIDIKQALEITKESSTRIYSDLPEKMWVNKTDLRLQTRSTQL